MNNKLWIGSFALFMGVIYLIMTFKIKPAVMGDPNSPKYFPLGLSILMILLSSVAIISGIREGRAEHEPKNEQPKDKNYIKLIVVTLLLGLGYTLILYGVGFVVSTVIFLGCNLFLVNGIKSWKANLIITFVFTLGIHYLFENVFSISLP